MPERASKDAQRRVQQGRGVAFLTSQVGALSSRNWNALVEKMGLDSRSAMLLWNVSMSEGRSQRELAVALHLPPSRIVEVVDALERNGWLERRVGRDDRRSRLLHLTAKGRRLMERMQALSLTHEERFTAGLDEAERVRLAGLLAKLAASRGLISTVHPDF